VKTVEFQSHKGLNKAIREVAVQTDAKKTQKTKRTKRTALIHGDESCRHLIMQAL
jgi:hypothetical protein